MKKYLLLLPFLLAGSVYAAPGCMNPNSINYDFSADSDDGSCLTCDGSNLGNCSQTGCSGLGDWNSSLAVCEPFSGCTDQNSSNYMAQAVVDDGSCTVCNSSNIGGCSQLACPTYGQWDSVNTVCIANQLGCSDPLAENYNPLANTGSTQNYCIYCSVSNPENCSNQSDCGLVGGSWNTGTAQCEPFSLTTPVSGSLSLSFPTGSTSSVSTSAPPLTSLVFSAQCSAYDSNNVCSSYDYYVEDAFFEFLNDSIFTSMVRIFFFASIFIIFVWVFRLVSSFF